MTKTQKRLLLFDIDGTLIHSGGAGVQALKSAFKERFGIDDDLHNIEIAGMTDSGIVVSILKKHKILLDILRNCFKPSKNWVSLSPGAASASSRQ